MIEEFSKTILGGHTLGTLMSNGIATPLQWLAASITAFTYTYADAHGVKPWRIDSLGRLVRPDAQQ